MKIEEINSILYQFFIQPHETVENLNYVDGCRKVEQAFYFLRQLPYHFSGTKWSLSYLGINLVYCRIYDDAKVCIEVEGKTVPQTVCKAIVQYLELKRHTQK